LQKPILDVYNLNSHIGYEYDGKYDNTAASEQTKYVKNA